MQPILRLHLLGHLSIEHNGTPVTTLSADRLQSLLAYLLLHRQAPQPRHHIAFQLWPDSSEPQARTNLRNLLHSLRQHLPEADRFLEVTNLTLQWRPDAPFILDVVAFQETLARAADAARQGDSSMLRQCLEAAVALYRGELLPGNYDDWIISLREELRHRFVEALAQLTVLLEGSGEVRTAIGYAQRLLGEDPLNETTYLTLMRLHAQSGDRSGVRRIYQQCVATLQRELAVEPSSTTQAAYETFLRMDVTIAQEAAQPELVLPAATDRQRFTPPVLPAPFVGRDKELAELAQLLADPHCRLLTITGPGGMGKSHLALQTARGHTQVYADGAAYVALVSVSSADLLPMTLVAGLGISLSGGVDPLDHLLEALQGKELLLVLDNFEHLLDRADLLTAILAHAPGVKLLVTSRERLNLHEEWVYDLQGLPVPDGEGETWEENSAVQLFLQSARKANAAFVPEEGQRAAITQICRLVEGMPLGLQLAAAWVRVLTPVEVVREIERSLAFLESSYRDIPERHRSLRAVFDHSWRLLVPEEQQVMRRLSIFRGGFERSAAEEVAGANLLVLSTLVDKSLVRRAEGGRYLLHELIRQYAEGALQEAGEWESTQDRHLMSFLSFASAHEAKMDGPDRESILAHLDANRDNYRAALNWGLNSVPADPAPPPGSVWTRRQAAGMELAALLSRYWYLRGYSLEGRRWLAAALAHVQAAGVANQDPATKALHARLLYGLGDLTGAIDDTRAARGLVEASLLLYQELDNKRGITQALHRLGEITLEQGNHEQAQQIFEEGLVLARELADAWLIARSLSQLATLALERGDQTRAEALCRESLTMFRAQGRTGSVIVQLNLLGQLAIARGALDEGIELLEEALMLNQTKTRQPMGAAWAWRSLGLAAQLKGAYDRATACYRESLILRQELHQSAGMAWAIEGLAEVAAATGHPHRAVRLWSIAETLRRTAGSEVSPGDRARAEPIAARVRDQLGKEIFDAVWTEGKAMSTTDAIAYALADT